MIPEDEKIESMFRFVSTCLGANRLGVLSEDVDIDSNELSLLLEWCERNDEDKEEWIGFVCSNGGFNDSEIMFNITEAFQNNNLMDYEEAKDEIEHTEQAVEKTKERVL